MTSRLFAPLAILAIVLLGINTIILFSGTFYPAPLSTEIILGLWFQVVGTLSLVTWSVFTIVKNFIQKNN